MIGGVQFGETQYAQPKSPFDKFKTLIEYLNITDTIARLTKKTFNDIFDLTDLLTGVKTLFKTVTETLELLDTFTFSVKKAFSEALSLVDSIVKQIIGSVYTDYLELRESFTFSAKVFFQDVIELTGCLLKKLNGFYVLWKKRLYEDALSFTKRDRPTLTEYTKRDNVEATWDKQERPTTTTYTKRDFSTSTWDKRERPGKCSTD